MVDLEGKDKGNISLPPCLQSPDLSDPNFVDDEHRLPIINMQKALYDIKISDLEKRLRRLEDRNGELSETYANTEDSINALDIETGDHIAYLNRQISVQTDKIEENRRSMNFIEKLREEEKEIHLRNVNLANEKYETTRVVLTSAIKALNTQINTLEDYKQTRDELREKLRIRDEYMAQNEEEVTQRLDAVDRKFKIDRDKLKNEMYSQLLALAGSFQIEISNATAIPVDRLIRENIFIKKELMLIANESLKKKREDYTIMRSVENLRSNSIKIDYREKINHLKSVKLQRCLIKALKIKHSDMKKRLENLEIPEALAQEKYDNLAESVRLELEAFETRTRKLQVLLHQETVKFGRAKFIHRQAELKAKKYEEILYDLKYAVACALKIAESGEDILEISETQLISHLLNLIVGGNSQIQCLGIASAESVPRPNDIDAKGDLGFVPNHIDFEDSIIGKVGSGIESLKVTPIDVPQVTRVFPPTFSLKDYGDDFENIVEVSAKGSSESTVTTTSKETKESSRDLREDISLIESVDDEETIREIEESIDGELNDEEQE